MPWWWSRSTIGFTSNCTFTSWGSRKSREASHAITHPSPAHPPDLTPRWNLTSFHPLLLPPRRLVPSRFPLPRHPVECQLLSAYASSKTLLMATRGWAWLAMGVVFNVLPLESKMLGKRTSYFLLGLCTVYTVSCVYFLASCWNKEREVLN